MDSLTAARWQMTISLAFHMVYAAVGIGLPLLLVMVEGMYLRTGQEQYKKLAKKWSKVMGLLFAVGAVSGTALSLELGLLWPAYMEIMGAVVGHIFGLEGYAFFLEAIFIGIYLYAWDKISPLAHWLSGVVIATTGMLSGIFVLGVNAWMQQPVGFEMADKVVTVTDPIAIFKQPLWFYMAWHSTLACYLSVAFAVAGWYSYLALKGRNDAYVRSGLIAAMLLGGVCAFLQPMSGDLLAKFVFKTQPTKFAAMEGQFKTEKHAPLRIGGWPDEKTRETKYAIEIPGGLSFIATGDSTAEVPGLDRVPERDWPNIELTHLAFQIMVGSGTALMFVSVWFWIAWFRYRENVLSSRWLMRALIVCTPLGFIGLESGWMVTELGRQPWVIQGLMRTKDAVTPVAGVQGMFVAFTLLYGLLTVMVIALLWKLAQSSKDGEVAK
ncbi:cytochrome ubiquinol oxidase subunit I [Anatilimnocola floriformis]|uniref:cytochrome ubiquinol oxidase subunit I n=1 Tax=Anatilimnocola floriformis TaxID=2948575 RepID=UPI0020C27E8C|nr:cytochrome ubiquinol oxidase subunit I [Anatilimnocola floriformis]